VGNISIDISHVNTASTDPSSSSSSYPPLSPSLSPSSPSSEQDLFSEADAFTEAWDALEEARNALEAAREEDAKSSQEGGAAYDYVEGVSSQEEDLSIRTHPHNDDYYQTDNSTPMVVTDAYAGDTATATTSTVAINNADTEDEDENAILHRISIVGEHNSGMERLTETLQACFPSMDVRRGLAERDGYWFQDHQDTDAATPQKNTLVVDTFLNPYAWVDEMRRATPPTAPAHASIPDWETFVTTHWTTTRMARPEADAIVGGVFREQSCNRKPLAATSNMYS
jgi:hypothetical protein